MWKSKQMEDDTINKISLAIEVQYYKEMLCKLLQLHENKWLELNEKGIISHPSLIVKLIDRSIIHTMSPSITTNESSGTMTSNSAVMRAIV